MTFFLNVLCINITDCRAVFMQEDAFNNSERRVFDFCRALPSTKKEILVQNCRKIKQENLRKTIGSYYCKNVVYIRSGSIPLRLSFFFQMFLSCDFVPHNTMTETLKRLSSLPI